MRHFLVGDIAYSDHNGPAVERGKPVIVIDPEDRDQVEGLTRKWFRLDPECVDYPYTGRDVDIMQAALRSLIEPPKPEEPTGLGAVAEDADGDLWVCVNRGTGTREWRNTDYNGEYRRWDAISAVRVLSDGVQP